jgi:hypothetical protein
VFGNEKEVITFEAKIEQTGQTAIAPVDIGQAHNQLARAEGEYGPQGYAIRGTIVTHMEEIEPAADASAGVVHIIQKAAMNELWTRIRIILSLYRDNWSLDDMQARAAAATRIQAMIPQTGWMIRAIDQDQRFITQEHLLAEWGAVG